jgi:hypothetical protein
MKIKLNEIDTSEKGFRVQEREIGGETVFLVTPNHVGTKWSKVNV